MKASSDVALVPISACLVSQAARNVDGAFRKLAARAKFIAQDRRYTFWHCMHPTPCPAVTRAQFDELVVTIPDLAPVSQSLFPENSHETH